MLNLLRHHIRFVVEHTSVVYDIIQQTLDLVVDYCEGARVLVCCIDELYVLDFHTFTNK